MDIKKVIKGVAKFTGKYTLKGLGKGAELLCRGAVKGVNALVRNPIAQTIGTLAISAVIPGIAQASIMLAGIRLMLSSLSKKKDLNGKFMDALNTGNILTRTVGNRILSPLLGHADRGLDRAGDWVQDKIDDMFR